MKIYTCILLFTFMVFLHSVESYKVYGATGCPYLVYSEFQIVGPAVRDGQEFVDSEGHHFLTDEHGCLQPHELPEPPTPNPTDGDVIKRDTGQIGILAIPFWFEFDGGEVDSYTPRVGDVVLRNGGASSRFGPQHWHFVEH